MFEVFSKDTLVGHSALEWGDAAPCRSLFGAAYKLLMASSVMDSHSPAAIG